MKNIIALLAMTMIMAACISPTTAKTQTALPQEKPTITPLPLDTKAPFPSTATSVALPELETNCVSILAASPPDFKLNGIALFLDRAMIVSMGKEALRIRIGGIEPSVSPHNKFLAYGAYGNDDLVVVTSNGTEIRRIETNIIASLVGDRWISEEYIRHLKLINRDPLQYQLLVISIQTGESLQLRMEFPDMEDGIGWETEGSLWRLYRGDKIASVIYDPSLNKAVYPKKGGFVSLYGVKEDKEQAAIKMQGSDPIWSPDGRYFTFKGWEQREPKEIYIISRDGNRFMPLTHLSQYYPQSLFGSYSWSPDSQKIAFWARKTDKYGEYETLFVFDLASRKIIDTCVQGIGSWGSIIEAGLASVGAGPSPLDKYFVLGGRLVWSPDSTKIIIAQFDEENQQVIDLLVDLETNLAYPIATGLEPMGWLLGEP